MILLVAENSRFLGPDEVSRHFEEVALDIAPREVPRVTYNSQDGYL